MTVPRDQYQSARWGFTMIELLAVVTIVGLTTAMVAPRIDLAHFRADAAMRSVGSTLMMAQRDAVARQHDVVVSFDPAANRLRVHWDANSNHLADDGEKVRIVPLEEGVVFGRPANVPARAFGTGAIALKTLNGVPVVIFRRSGTSSDAGGFYMTTTRALANGAKYAGDSRAIELERSTGRSEWFRFQGSAWGRGF